MVSSGVGWGSGDFALCAIDPSLAPCFLATISFFEEIGL